MILIRIYSGGKITWNGGVKKKSSRETKSILLLVNWARKENIFVWMCNLDDEEAEMRLEVFESRDTEER